MKYVYLHGAARRRATFDTTFTSKNDESRDHEIEIEDCIREFNSHSYNMKGKDLIWTSNWNETIRRGISQ